jgi:hypothetical protein
VKRAAADSPIAQLRSAETYSSDGSLPGTLKSLANTFDFSPPQSIQLHQQVPAWRLEGQWKNAWLPQVLPKQAIQEGKLPDFSKLPDHLFDRVAVFLGTDDLFPYRIEYLRRQAGKGQQVATDRIVAAIDYYQVELDQPNPAERFRYIPKASQITDETTAFLQQHGLKRAGG